MIAALPVPSAQVSAVDQPTGNAQPTVETDPVLNPGDAADDPAIWFHATDPARSVVVGNDNSGALEVYDLAGAASSASPSGFFGNVDVRRGFSHRNGHRRTSSSPGTAPASACTRIDPTTRHAHQHHRHGASAAASPCRSAATACACTAAAVDGSDVRVRQRQQRSRRPVRADRRRQRRPARRARCAADWDDRLRGRRLRRRRRARVTSTSAKRTSASGSTAAEPDRPRRARPARTLVDTTVADGGHISPDVEGLTIVYQPGGTGYLMASSQAGPTRSARTWSTSAKARTRSSARSRSSPAPLVDGCGRTDGIDALAADLGPAFPHGIFVCQDNDNTCSDRLGSRTSSSCPSSASVGLAAPTPPPRRPRRPRPRRHRHRACRHRRRSSAPLCPVQRPADRLPTP